jgi:hypothetical protein
MSGTCSAIARASASHESGPARSGSRPGAGRSAPALRARLRGRLGDFSFFDQDLANRTPRMASVIGSYAPGLNGGYSSVTRTNA